MARTFDLYEHIARRSASALDDGQARHTLAAHYCDRHNRGDATFWEVQAPDSSARRLETLLEPERHDFKMGLQKGQISIRHGVEDAIAAHIAFS